MKRDDKPVASFFPVTVDINPTAKCNLDCSFCWGPEHTRLDTLDTEAWQRVLDYFSSRGTKSVVFTGGEPLLRRDIGALVQHARNDGLRVILSTNALLLCRKGPEVLPYIDEIGIPLDGSTAEQNSKMRLLPGRKRGSMQHFDAALSALRNVGEGYPGIEITVRTVASKVNIDNLESIGELLVANPHVDRWKVYQFTPVSIGRDHRREHEISDIEFVAVGKALITRFPTMNIQAYPSVDRVGRYVFIGPEGDIYGVAPTGMYQGVGNFLTMSDDEISQGFAQLINGEANALHGAERGGHLLSMSRVERPENSFQIGAQAILVREGKVLMGLRRGNFGESTWGLPGGRLQRGETLQDAMERELEEEHGVGVNQCALICVVDPVQETNFQPQVAFLVTDFTGEPIIKEKLKCFELRWFPLDALPENTFIASKLILEKYLSGRKY